MDYNVYQVKHSVRKCYDQMEGKKDYRSTPEGIIFVVYL